MGLGESQISVLIRCPSTRFHSLTRLCREHKLRLRAKNRGARRGPDQSSSLMRERIEPRCVHTLASWCVCARIPAGTRPCGTQLGHLRSPYRNQLRRIPSRLPGNFAVSSRAPPRPRDSRLSGPKFAFPADQSLGDTLRQRRRQVTVSVV